MPRRWSNSDSSLYADPRLAELSDHRICPCRGRHPAIQRRPHTVSNALRAFPSRFIRRAARHCPIRPASGSGTPREVEHWRHVATSLVRRVARPIRAMVPKSAKGLCHVDVADRCRNFCRVACFGHWTPRLPASGRRCRAWRGSLPCSIWCYCLRQTSRCAIALARGTT